MTRIAITAIALAFAVPAYAQQLQLQPAPGQDMPPPAGAQPAPTQPNVTIIPPAGQTQAPATAEAPGEKMAAAGERFLQAQKPDHHLATRLSGRDVYNAAGQSIGNLNDILIDQDGNVVAVIVGVGGFLGLGQKDVAVDFEFVKASGGFSGERLVMGMTEEELRNAPTFERLERGARTAETPAAGSDAPGGASGAGTGTRTQ